jgi:plastocyanin
MTASRIRLAALTLTGVATVGVLAACGSSDGTAGSPAPTPVTSSAAPADPSSSAPAKTGKPIAVTETEYKIAMGSTSLSAGTYTFDVKNAGHTGHALTVDGPGVEDQTTGLIEPGQSGTVTVTLAKGTYDVYCPVGDHKAMGMDESLTVS